MDRIAAGVDRLASNAFVIGENFDRIAPNEANSGLGRQAGFICYQQAQMLAAMRH
jgi:hypothetical protein